MRSLSLLSPAKINLSLYVVGKLPDGYHRLVTLFHRISLTDTLTLRKKSSGFQLSCSNPALDPGESNLITKAYRHLQREIPDLGGVSVRLTKRIPLQGGLGGGSSNAAFFLLGMRRLYRLPLSQRQLLRIGERLGADVPFFLYNVSQARGEHRGDVIRPQPARRMRWFVLVLFQQGVSTAACFKAYKDGGASLTKKRRVARIRCLLSDHGDSLDVAAKLYNDLEGPAFRFNPSIREVMALLVQLGAPAVAMSGSGPTVFAMVDDLQEARNLKKRLEQRLLPERIRICRTF